MEESFEVVKGMIDFAAKSATFDQLFRVLKKSIERYEESKTEEHKGVVCTTCLIISAKKAHEDVEAHEGNGESPTPDQVNKGFMDSLEDFLNNK